ncbi:MAG TPA: sugar ABC transporter ATP-binding protein [Bacillota bacterium]
MMEMDTDFILEMRDIVKKFAGVHALDKVNFLLKPGEIHALVGANGAGKSTLMKVLAGIYPDYEGTIILHGKEIRFSNPRLALESGIAVIYQEFNLVPQLTVAENILLGREPLRKLGRIPLLNWPALHDEAAELLAELKFTLPLDVQVAELGVADQQLVQIAKAMATHARVLVMDEPTARLSRTERDNLFEIMRRLKVGGTSIVYISHFLEEVFMIAERVTVMRDGRNAGTALISELNRPELIKMMLGHEVMMDNSKRDTHKDQAILNVEHLSNSAKFQDVSFSLYAGEILGIAGLVGSGRTELARTIFGAEPRKKIRGRIDVNGSIFQATSPKAAISRGIGLAPEDRKQQGLVLIRPVEDNILLSSTSRLRHGWFMDLSARRQLMEKMIQRLSIKCTDSKVLAGTLSGGNQQKVVLAKWLAAKTHILILDQPTAGIDIGTKEEIYRLLRELADDGSGLIVISDDPEELSRICSRVLIMRKGRMVKELTGNPSSEEVLAGVTAEY